MKQITLTAIAAAIALAFGANAIAADGKSQTAPAKSETPREYAGDAAITAKVKAAFVKDSSLKATEINVETYKGIVQLSGFVNTAANTKKAVKVAKTIKGVKSVKNDMVVKGTQ